MSPAERAKAVVAEYVRGPSGGGRLPRLVAAMITVAENEAVEACAKLCDDADKSTHPATLADRIRMLKR